MASDEDKRTAVEFSVTLSGQLISAALAMLAVVGGYVAYVMCNRTPSPLFPWLSAAASIAFITSIFVAGKAITESRNAGFEGNWSLEVGRPQYNLQAVLCAVGLVCFAVSLFFSGQSTADKTDAAITQLRSAAATTSKEIGLLSVSNATTTTHVTHAMAEIDNVRVALSRLSATVDRLQQTDATRSDLLRQRNAIASNETQAIIDSLDRIAAALDQLGKVPTNGRTVPVPRAGVPSGQP